MKPLKTYLLILTSTLCLFNCKKYPEGGCERRGPKNIIGNWNLTLYEVNGIDSTDLINYNGNDNYKKISFNKRQGTYNKDLDCRINGKNGMSISFDAKKENITFEAGDLKKSIVCEAIISNDCYRMIFVPEAADNYRMEWNVIKLTKKEIKLKASNKNTYQITLSK